MESLKQSELYELSRCMDKNYQTIAIKFLGYSEDEIEEIQESHKGNLDKVKLMILNGWLLRNTVGNPRYVSQM